MSLQWQTKLTCIILKDPFITALYLRLLKLQQLTKPIARSCRKKGTIFVSILRQTAFTQRQKLFLCRFNLHLTVLTSTCSTLILCEHPLERALSIQWPSNTEAAAAVTWSVSVSKHNKVRLNHGETNTIQSSTHTHTHTIQHVPAIL